MARKKNSLENILSKGERQDNGCLFYTNNQKKNGYSLVSYCDQMMPVHRVVFLLSGKTLPPTFDVHHTCHNRSCIESTHLEALSRSQHALLSEQDLAQRNQRLRALLSYDPTVELLPITVTSTTIGTLWGCQSHHVPILLQKIQETYPGEFFWRALHRGRRGRKPSVFEVRIMPGLVEKLLHKDEQRETSAEDIMALLV
jgi:hypothetical protein